MIVIETHIEFHPNLMKRSNMISGRFLLLKIILLARGCPAGSQPFDNFCDTSAFNDRH